MHIRNHTTARGVKSHNVLNKGKEQIFSKISNFTKYEALILIIPMISKNPNSSKIKTVKHAITLKKIPKSQIH